MRMSDIIKLNLKSSVGRKLPYAGPGLKKEEEGIKMSRLFNNGIAVSDDSKNLDDLYQRYSESVTSIYDAARSDFLFYPSQNMIQELAAELVETLELSNINIMDFFLRQQGSNYIYSHSVNAAFMSVMLGVWLKRNRSELIQLALAATFYDIGMLKLENKSLLSRELTAAERKEISRHPDYSEEYARSIPGIDKPAVDAVKNHHNLSAARPAHNYLTSVIYFTDSFEAMTHDRLYRKAVEPYAAIKNIIENKKAGFDREVVKSFIDNIGIYPAGTWVALDTGESALVIDANSGSPLSPKVNILFDKDGNKLASPRTVDLSRQSNIRVKKPLEESETRKLKEAILSK